MEKLPGVESASVSLNEGQTTIDLKPENTITIGEIRRRVEQNGFTPREARVSARVEVLERDGRLRVKVAGTDESYDLTAATTAGIVDQLRSRAGRTAAIEGTIPVPEDPETPPAMEITKVLPG